MLHFDPLYLRYWVDSGSLQLEEEALLGWILVELSDEEVRVADSVSQDEHDDSNHHEVDGFLSHTDLELGPVVDDVMFEVVTQCCVENADQLGKQHNDCAERL